MSEIDPPAKIQSAHLALRAGPVAVRMGVEVTPAGIWAIAGLMSGILLSTAVLVGVAVSAKRK
ncbi:hypothetical protein PQU92_09370 [Asticcacaulis sp. BYS171W]|uniref:Uncharacterized protein n=1 Tax=Asticcacaulis aquaticus TaxID=2984212 RepID=A0ABT5HU31_9CAUL|nr:hypothetical protein [Asticcacaulis aquaticus]MDC7683484.1 hypothetical protein [Asticcacaulis aquaticus]